MSHVSPAKTLDQVRALRGRDDRIRAFAEYIKNGEEKLAEARRLRDKDVLDLIGEVGPAEAARRSGLSLSTIKLIRGRP